MLRCSCVVWIVGGGLLVGCGPAPTARPPIQGPAIQRVVLISVDTCRADHLSCYGFDKNTTPHLDALAAAGVLFERVVSPVPLTLPAHSSMLTGTNPTFHGVHDNHAYRLADAHLTLAELLKQRGFSTAAFVSTFILDSQFGLDQGFDLYEDEISGDHQVHGSFHERKGDRTTQLALEWLDDRQGDDFFLFLHYFDPHEDYEPPEPFADRFADNPYAGEIAFTDHCIGRVVQKLKDLGLYETTLIMVTGDHGELLGEHGEPTHSYFIYRGAIEVPWIVKLPGPNQEDKSSEGNKSNQGKRIGQIAGLIDIVPTLCGLMGIEPPPQVQGVDWSAELLADQPAATRERALYCESFTPTKYGATPLLGVVGHDLWKYIHAPQPELYDLNNDPLEAANRAADEPHRARVLEAELQDLLAAAPAPGDQENQLAVSEADLRRLGSLGYVGGKTEVGQFEFDAQSVDPKELFALHMQHQEATIRLLDKEYARARVVAEEMVRSRPESPLGHKHLAKIAADQGRLREAQPHLEALVRLDPNDVEGHTNLGVIYRAQGDTEAAVAAYRRALEIDPAHTPALNNLAFVLLAKNQVDEAIDLLEQALQLDPHYADAHFNLGQALVRTGEPAAAAQHFRRALQERRDWPAALNALGWLLATSPDSAIRDPSEAVRLAELTVKLTGERNVPILDTLSAAYAAAGQFEQAIEVAEKALQLAIEADAQALVDILRGRLELYRGKEAFVERAP